MNNGGGWWDEESDEDDEVKPVTVNEEEKKKEIIDVSEEEEETGVWWDDDDDDNKAVVVSDEKKENKKKKKGFDLSELREEGERLQCIGVEEFKRLKGDESTLERLKAFNVMVKAHRKEFNDTKVEEGENRNKAEFKEGQHKYPYTRGRLRTGILHLVTRIPIHVLPFLEYDKLPQLEWKAASHLPGAEELYAIQRTLLRVPYVYDTRGNWVDERKKKRYEWSNTQHLYDFQPSFRQICKDKAIVTDHINKGDDTVYICYDTEILGNNVRSINYLRELSAISMDGTWSYHCYFKPLGELHKSWTLIEREARINTDAPEGIETVSLAEGLVLFFEKLPKRCALISYQPGTRNDEDGLFTCLITALYDCNPTDRDAYWKRLNTPAMLDKQVRYNRDIFPIMRWFILRTGFLMDVKSKQDLEAMYSAVVRDPVHLRSDYPAKVLVSPATIRGRSRVREETPPRPRSRSLSEELDFSSDTGTELTKDKVVTEHTESLLAKSASLSVSAEEVPSIPRRFKFHTAQGDALALREILINFLLVLDLFRHVVERLPNNNIPEAWIEDPFREEEDFSFPGREATTRSNTRNMIDYEKKAYENIVSPALADITGWVYSTAPCAVRYADNAMLNHVFKDSLRDARKITQFLIDNRHHLTGERLANPDKKWIDLWWPQVSTRTPSGIQLTFDAFVKRYRRNSAAVDAMKDSTQKRATKGKRMIGLSVENQQPGFYQTIIAEHILDGNKLNKLGKRYAAMMGGIEGETITELIQRMKLYPIFYLQGNNKLHFRYCHTMFEVYTFEENNKTHVARIPKSDHKRIVVLDPENHDPLWFCQNCRMYEKEIDPYVPPFIERLYRMSHKELYYNKGWIARRKQLIGEVKDKEWRRTVIRFKGFSKPKQTFLIPQKEEDDEKYPPLPQEKEPAASKMVVIAISVEGLVLAAVMADWK